MELTAHVTAAPIVDVDKNETGTVEVVEIETPIVDVDKNTTGIVPVWLVGVWAWTVEPDPDNVTAPVTAAPNVEVVAKLTGIVDVVDIEHPIVDVVAKLIGTVDVVDNAPVIAAPIVDVDKNETGMVPVWLATTDIAAPKVDVVAKETGTVEVVDNNNLPVDSTKIGIKVPDAC